LQQQGLWQQISRQRESGEQQVSAALQVQC